MAASESRLKDLMVRALDGDAGAYRMLLHDLSGHLRSYYSRRLGGSAADAEDLVQETLLAIHTRRASYDRSLPFTAWLYAIARYKLIDHYRRSRIRHTLPLEAASDVFIPDETEAATAPRDLDRLMTHIPERQQTLIRDVKLQGLSVAEAAAKHDVSESVVKVSVHRGLKALIGRMGKEADREH